MTSRNVFITGGAGFIGRWLASRCLQDGHRVTVYDDFSAGTRENLQAFADRITICEGDILDRNALRAAMTASSPDVVFHLAALHFIPFCTEHPVETLRVNADGTFAVLDAAVEAGADVAVVASSGVVYPSVDDPLTEDLERTPPDIYGLSKLLTEEVTKYVASTSSMKCVAARLFNTYGAYETNPHLIPHLMDSLRRGGPIPLGNIYSKRDYIYVEDVADLLLRSALSAADAYTVVNVGTGVEYSAEELVETLGRLLGRSLTVDVDPDRLRPVDKMHQRADTTRLEALTGTTARHSIEDGLGKLLQHEGLLPAAPVLS